MNKNQQKMIQMSKLMMKILIMMSQMNKIKTNYIMILH